MQVASDELLRPSFLESRFQIGDRVIDRSGRAWTITFIFHVQRQYRFFVRGDDGTESITIDHELIAESDSVGDG
jgi:hypothetical protein